MKLKKLDSTFQLTPQGTHAARITMVADLGLQTSAWSGENKRVPKLGLTFELVNEGTQEGRPLTVFDRVTSSLHEKSRLSEVVRAALSEVPEELDVKDLLGKEILVQVVHRTAKDGNIWANIQTVSPLLENMEVRPTDTPLLYFDLECPDVEMFKQLPALFRKAVEKRVRPGIKGSEEPNTEEALDDDVPW